MYLGGNGIDCEIEYGGELAARHLVHVPDEREPAESHLQSRFHWSVEPSARLLGVTFSATGEGTAAPYEVVSPDHWAFAGTGLRSGDRFGERTRNERTPGGASGLETDKRTASSPPDTILLAKGTNPDGGGAEMVIARPVGERGGAVFSTGSITYVSALLTDPAVSMITETVLRSFSEEPLA